MDLSIDKLLNWSSVNAGSGVSLPETLQAKFTFLWLGTINSNQLVDVISGQNITVTGKDFTTTIPYTSAATFAMANVAGLKTDDDFDGAWFTDAGAVRSVTAQKLIDCDFSRTLVKYANASPYEIEWIGLLQKGVSITSDEWNQLHTYFRLGTYWSGVFNSFGYVKDNRVQEGQGYKGWAATLTSLGLTAPATAVNASINKFCLDLINGASGSSVLSGMDALWMFMLNDSSLVAGAGTVTLQNPSRTRLAFTVAPTYTTSGFEGNASSMYADTNFNTSLGTNFVRDSASRGMYKYKAGTTGGLDGHLSSALNGMFIAGSTQQRINSGVALSASFSTTGTGYKAMNRTTSNDVQGYNPSVNNYTNASSAPANDTLKLLRNVTANYSDAGLSMYFVGRSFTSTEHGIISTSFTAHKTRLGL